MFVQLNCKKNKDLKKDIHRAQILQNVISVAKIG